MNTKPSNQPTSIDKPMTIDNPKSLLDLLTLLGITATIGATIYLIGSGSSPAPQIPLVESSNSLQQGVGSQEASKALLQPFKHLPEAYRAKVEYNLIQQQQMTNQEKKELQCLASAIYWEAGNQSYQGKTAVAEVIQNRVNSSKFQDSYCSVVKAPRQFSFKDEGKEIHGIDKRIHKSNQAEKIQYILSTEIALDVLKGESKDRLLPTGTTFYHADYVKPKWSNHMIKVKQIQDHVFYKEKV